MRPYAGAVGSGLLKIKDNARTDVDGMCQQFLQDEGIHAIDWPVCSKDLNYNLVLFRYQHIYLVFPVPYV